jgi:hypothetical protein
MSFEREKNGKRLVMAGALNTVSPPDSLKDGEYAYLQNCRRLNSTRITGRPTADSSLFNVGAPPHTIERVDYGGSTVRMVGAGSNLYVNSTLAVDSGFSGNPLSLVTLEPNQSVSPWVYVGDSSQAVTIVGTGQQCTSAVKVRASDGLTRKTGIKEPQYSPVIGINIDSSAIWLSLPANTPPWTNQNGSNPNQNYSGTDTHPPYPTIIPTPVYGATVQLTVTGTATVNGNTHAPGDSGPSGAGYPGNFITSPEIVVYAFTDADGNIIAQSSAVGAPPVLGNVGASATITVPYGAAQLQIGINSEGGNFSANSGAFTVQGYVSTNAITTNTSIVGLVMAYVWGDSPHTGPVASYIWKNPNDGGTGISRSIGTAQASPSNNSLIFDSTPEDSTVPVQWTTLQSNGSTVGTIPLFSPALESEGYEDFNACIVGQLFFPAPGIYDVQIKCKDQVMFGMGGGITSTSQPVYGANGQSITVVNGYPLLYVTTVNGEGGQQTFNLTVQVPALGVYGFEFNWDYWYHTGRSLIVEIGPTPGAPVALIPPQPPSVRTNVQYWAKYRATETGAVSNPSPGSMVELTPVLTNTIQVPYSNDPQVAVYDLYRQDQGLPNPTYVATGPNDGLGGTINGIVYNTAIEDTLSDLAAATNPTMDFDDFEPFPSVGAPLSGMVTIVDGVVTWKSGNKFPLDMLAGTIILIGSPTQTAYTLFQRPLSATTLVLEDVADTIGDAAGDGVPFNIAQPILAQQPLPSMWGPDAYGFTHACGDPNQPGAYKWTKAYNPDSAPDTNTLLLTSPSDPLMGGGLINGVSMVFSTRYAWLMYPNFANAVATATGIQGNQWQPILAMEDRGLYIRNCLCSLGGKAIAFRANDGIYRTSGSGSKSITQRIYNLFPHENYKPSPVTVGPYTVYPPNDSLPQKLAYQNGYIYWDYQDVNGTYRTLVYDEAAEGWSVDVGGGFQFSCHAGEFAPGVNDTAVGCSDGSVRILKSGGIEPAVSVVATGAENGGDARALKRMADVFVRAIVNSSPVTVGLYANQYQTALTGYSPASLAANGVLSPYVLDWGGNQPQDLIDIEATFSWPTNNPTELDLWQPDFFGLPLAIQTRVTEATSCGLSDWGHCYLVDLQYASSQPVTVTLNTDQGDVSVTFPAAGSLFVPAKIALKVPPLKWKTCAWQVTSSAEWYLFDLVGWIGTWERSREYEKFHPFGHIQQAGGVR